MNLKRVSGVVGAGCFAAALAAADGTAPQRALSGGDTTVFRSDRDAFSAPARNLAPENMEAFMLGRALFRREWVIAPGKDEDGDGLGPLFNRTSCAGCHVKDGRGRPPADPEEPMTSMFVRLGVPGTTPEGGPRPHPIYGDQLSDRGILGVPKEGRAVITYETIAGRFGDGARFSLRKPEITLTDLSYGAIEEDVLLSARVAPALIGLGLLEAVEENAILARSDPDDRDGDGISGKTNRVWDAAEREQAVGRFGWKASQPTLRQQIAGALLGDIGLTTRLFMTENCSPVQTDCLSAPHGGTPEVDDARLDQLLLYVRALAVPARRGLDDPVALHGETLFADIGCAACHVPAMKTGDHPVAALAHQTIRPYTDLLLHDMGESLADGGPDFAAGRREWRTPPLWGIGLVEVVNDHTNFLHDGRARNLTEAVLWHGGEAEAAREAFRTLPGADRAALIRFLETL